MVDFLQEQKVCVLRWVRRDENGIRLHGHRLEGFIFACLRYAICVLQASDEPRKRDLYLNRIKI